MFASRIGPNQLALNPSHPLNKGRLFWYLATQKRKGCGSGQQWFDLVDNVPIGINGTATFSPPPGTSSNRWGSILTPGSTGNYVGPISFPAFTSTQLFTLIFWFYPITWTPGNGFTCPIDDSGRVWSIFFNTSGVSNSTGTVFTQSGNQSYPAGALHQSAITYNGAGGHVDSYIDGKVVWNQTGASFTLAAASVHFGDNPSAGGTAANAYYLSIALWNRNFSPADVWQDWVLNPMGYPGVLTQRGKVGLRGPSVAALDEGEGINYYPRYYW